MNDYNSSANDAFSPQQERGRSGSMMSLGNLPMSPQGPPSDNGGAAVDDAMNKSQNPDGDSTSPTQATGSSGANSEQLKQVSDVLSSEVQSASEKVVYSNLNNKLTLFCRLE